MTVVLKTVEVRRKDAWDSDIGLTICSTHMDDSNIPCIYPIASVRASQPGLQMVTRLLLDIIDIPSNVYKQ